MISKHKLHPDHKGGRIILASDSQTTYPGGQKRLDSRKMTIVEFANARVLVAQAGSADLADKAVEILQRNAKEIKVANVETVPQTIQAAVREVRNYLMEVNKGCNFSDADWKSFFRDDNAFTLLFGYYFEIKPHLYTVDIDWCLAVPVRTSFKAIGCGATLGEFLLKQYSEAVPDFEHGDVIATSVVEKVIENVEGCGRPSWVGIIEHVPDSKAAGYPGYKDGDIVPADKVCNAFICRRKCTDAIADALRKQENDSKPKTIKQLRNTVVSLCRKIGPLVYTESDDPEGDSTFRMSIYGDNQKDIDRALAKATKKRHPGKDHR
jgi:20S proteasome alpha/beta subunit